MAGVLLLGGCERQPVPAAEKRVFIPPPKVATTAELTGKGALEVQGGHVAPVREGEAVTSCGEPGSPALLEATRWHQPDHWFDAELPLPEPRRYLLPGELTVTEGNAGNHPATLTLTPEDGGAAITCRYRGGADEPHPAEGAQLQAAAQYRFEGCSDGSRPGSVVAVRALKLRLEEGGNRGPGTRTAARVVLQPAGGAPVGQEAAP